MPCLPRRHYIDRCITAVTTNTRPQRFFCPGSNLRSGGRQSTVTMVFHALVHSRFFSRFSSTRKNMSAFKPFLLQNPALHHVHITRSTNLLSVCWRKRKLSTYLHTVSYNHISFLNARSQLVWVLTTSGFYSITWRMISRSAGYKIHFRKQPQLHSEETLSLVGVIYISFVSLNSYSNLFNSSSTDPVFSYNQINKQPENLYVNCRACFGYFS